MGLDVTGILAFGVKLPEDFKITEDNSLYEDLDLLFYSYTEEPVKYKNLELVLIGDCDDPEYIVACKNSVYSVDWTAKPINFDELRVLWNQVDELNQFKADFDIKLRSSWYLGCYSSY